MRLQACPPDTWRCVHEDDGHRCPAAAYYHGLCYRHRRDAPPPDTRYPIPGHHCVGCER
jgi:hypothetical protein